MKWKTSGLQTRCINKASSVIRRTGHRTRSQKVNYFPPSATDTLRSRRLCHFSQMIRGIIYVQTMAKIVIPLYRIHKEAPTTVEKQIFAFLLT